MATDYGQKWNEGVDPAFYKRVAIALKIVALAKVASGWSIDADEERREKRVVRAILSTIDGLAQVTALAMTASTTIDSSSTDGQIEGVISAAFDKLTWLVDDANGT
jgi:hypothetical protein